MNRVYLDHAATTPMLPVAIQAMSEQLRRTGNPSSLHASGRDARRVVEESRERIAQALDCRPGEVVFTSGGTEADNLALKGTYWARRQADDRRRRILTTSIEHHAVLDPLEWLADDEDAEVELLPVDREGRLDLEALRDSVLRDPAGVALISVMWANNEVGTLQPVAEVAELAAEHGIPVHTDAVQAVGHVPVEFAKAGACMLALSGHKVGGPLGVGALVVCRDHDLAPLTHGGGQEREVRSGTIDTPAVAGLAAAIEWSVKHLDEHAATVTELRTELIEGIRAQVPDVVVNGAPTRSTTVGALPGIAHLSFPGCEGDSLLMLLDAQGVECATGSACSAGVPQPSHVLLAMGRDEKEARSSLRFSLSHTNSHDDVAALVDVIGFAVERARAAGMSGSPSKSDTGKSDT